MHLCSTLLYSSRQPKYTGEVDARKNRLDKFFSIFQKQRKNNQVASKMKNFNYYTIEKYYEMFLTLILKHFWRKLTTLIWIFAFFFPQWKRWVNFNTNICNPTFPEGEGVERRMVWKIPILLIIVMLKSL